MRKDQANPEEEKNNGGLFYPRKLPNRTKWQKKTSDALDIDRTINKASISIMENESYYPISNDQTSVLRDVVSKIHFSGHLESKSMYQI